MRRDKSDLVIRQLGAQKVQTCLSRRSSARTSQPLQRSCTFTFLSTGCGMNGLGAILAARAGHSHRGSVCVCVCPTLDKGSSTTTLSTLHGQGDTAPDCRPCLTKLCNLVGYPAWPAGRTCSFFHKLLHHSSAFCFMVLHVSTPKPQFCS